MSNASTQLYAIQVGKLYYGFRAKTDLYKNILSITGVVDPNPNQVVQTVANLGGNTVPGTVVGAATAATTISLQPKTPLRFLTGAALIIPLQVRTADGKKHIIYCASDKVATGAGNLLNKSVDGSNVTNVSIHGRRYLK